MKDEALKLALEALETCEVAWPGTRFKSKYFAEDEVKAAITAIKQALAAPVQEPVAIVVAAEYEDGSPAGHRLEWRGRNEQDDFPEGTKFYTTPPAAQPAPVQEPVAWKWHQAPIKTSWGHDMVVADLAIDKDNTVSVYCERDQTTKVQAMFSTPPAAQRQWVGLDAEQIRKAKHHTVDGAYHYSFKQGAEWAEAKLKELNT